MAKLIRKTVAKVSAPELKKVLRKIPKPAESKPKVAGKTLPLGGRTVKAVDKKGLEISVNPSWSANRFNMTKFCMGWRIGVSCSLYTHNQGQSVVVTDAALDNDNKVDPKTCNYFSKAPEPFGWRKISDGEACMLRSDITEAGQLRLAEYLDLVRKQALEKLSPELLQKVIDGE